MAEQAINTIYLLGEQPDALCATIIKNQTTRVFSAPSSSSGPAAGDEDGSSPAADPTTPDATPAEPATPARDVDLTAPTPATAGEPRTSDDTMGSFPLAQLVFTVGHVAIKHIVYLELVEREFKRRKDENAKGA